ncbi:MAG: Acidobacterial duplicated orphan permease (function unknown) [uncultured Cytophagales bacterium]|uniref:ABC transporter, permease protein n=1 Tax=uncultured Cytophagales bacterium TaxID=158755 RepID=A0A6J4KTE4_9SPHI|nr:MAG: Acidobacterial duplicated orphan permease (function unknown) [uncultured Cytophagales bacterium]
MHPSNPQPKAHPTPSPPRWARRLLSWWGDPATLEEVQGDMLELYAHWEQTLGTRKARRRYSLTVLGLLRPFAKRNPYPTNPNPFLPFAMLSNYLLVAWRNLRRYKGYSLINIGGLSVGLAVALLIGLWVHHEYSYDAFLPEGGQLYQVRRNFNNNGDTLTFASTSLRLAEALRNQVPEIEYVAECGWAGNAGITVGDMKTYVNGKHVGSDFLIMFRYPLLQGNAESVLRDPYSIVLSESTARAFFGNENPVGKTVRFDNESDLRVTGILKDLPSNSSMQFDFLVPFSHLEAVDPSVKAARSGSFARNQFNLFVKLKPGVSQAQVAPKIALIQHTETGNSNAMNSVVILQPLRNWHLYSNYVNGRETAGLLTYVRMFTLVGILVVVIAAINFVNLTTARSAKRAREVGIRKAIGSRRGQLIVQFLTESLLLTLAAFGLSLLMVWGLLPAFNAMLGKPLAIPYGSAAFWLVVLGGIGVTSVLAGGLPALYLSSFEPVKVLKGALRVGPAAAWPRKVLVVTQFSCSIALIMGAVVIYQQIEHARNRPTGYNINRLLVTHTNSELSRNYTIVKDELLRGGIVESVTQATSPATDIWWHGGLDRWPGQMANENVEMGFIKTGTDYLETMGMTLAAGRDFRHEHDTSSTILNETAVKLLRLKDPIGQRVSWQGREYTIAGVAKDALMQNPFAAAEPIMFTCSPEPMPVMLYRLSPRIATSEALSRMTALFGKYNPAYPYNYSFADQDYAEKFNLELLIGKLAGIFAGLAIFISSLGLFGLAAYMAEQRTKEIGVRKVLGATVMSIWGLLSKDFMGLVLIAFVIATPTASYFLESWLAQYDYRTALSWWVFAAVGIAAVAITLLTVSYQSIKAALRNPVKSLRTE